MRKIFFIVVIFASFVASCLKNSPKAVAEKFITAKENDDFEEAKKYADESMGQILHRLADLEKSLPKGNEEKEVTIAKKVTITKVEEDGNKAKVFYKVEGQEEEKSIDLKKVDGNWKVSFNKENAPNLDETESTEESFDEAVKELDSVEVQTDVK